EPGREPHVHVAQARGHAPRLPLDVRRVRDGRRGHLRGVRARARDPPARRRADLPARRLAQRGVARAPGRAYRAGARALDARHLQWLSPDRLPLLVRARLVAVTRADTRVPRGWQLDTHRIEAGTEALLGLLSRRDARRKRVDLEENA